MAQLKYRDENEFKLVGDHSLPIRYLRDGTPASDDYIAFDDGTGAKRCTITDAINSQGVYHKMWSIVLDKDNWELSSGKYIQTVNAEGAKTTNVLMSWADNPTEAQAEIYSDFEEVKCLTDETITVTSKSAPTANVAIKVQLIGSTISSSGILTAYLDANDWTLSEGKYIQTASVAGIDRDLSITTWIDDPTNDELIAFSEIEDISSNANNILTVIAKSEPEVDLTIKIKQ